MRLLSMGETARRLGVDTAKLRRSLQVDKRGREYLAIQGLRLTVYRKGLLGNRYFDADEIAHQLVQRARRQRLGGE